jgi:hypothetical protein
MAISRYPARNSSLPRYIAGERSPIFCCGANSVTNYLGKGSGMKRLTVFVVLGTLVGLVGTSAMAAEPAAKDAADQTAISLRVGTFDSRAVALAYYRKHLRSPEFVARMKKLKEDYDRAKAAGDNEKAKRLEAEGRGGQEYTHAQVFGSAPIDEILAKIKDRLPEVAKQAGVSVIVSKWNLAYRSPDAKFVDVTERLAKLFQPDESTMKMIRELPKHPPLSAEELKKHKDL